MRGQFTGAELRQWVDKLLDKYALSVWTQLCRQCKTSRQAENTFIYVFQVIIERLNKRIAIHLTDEWIGVVIKEALATSVPDMMIYFEEGMPATAEEDFETPEPCPVDTEMVPILLRRRTEQVMRAAIARKEAMRHHTGPLWIKIGATIVVVVGVVGVGYGLSDRVYARLHSSHVAKASDSQSTPSGTVGNLPVSSVGVYALSSKDEVDVNHMAVDGHTLYQGSLQSDTNGVTRIRVDAASLSTDDKPLSFKTDNARYEIILHPPAATTGSDSPGGIYKWRLQSTNGWLVAIVTWNSGESVTGDVTQIYALNIANGKYDLVHTLTPKAGVSNRFVVSVGSGRIIIQSALDDGDGAPLGLPIELYGLKGTNPAKAWTSEGQIPASFGLMDQPIATDEGVVFQGIVGKGQQTDQGGTSIWYRLAWDGELVKLNGPPVDAQLHWAVPSTSGGLWWVETTPDPEQHGTGFQVSMAELNGNKNAGETRNLDQAVSQFAVMGSYLAFVTQDSDKTEKLVVAQVNQ